MAITTDKSTRNGEDEDNIQEASTTGENITE